jgi:putative flippase GtrA
MSLKMNTFNKWLNSISSRRKRGKQPQGKKKQLSLSVILRYLFAATLNTILGIIVLFILHATGLPNAIVIVIAATLGFLYSYINYKEIVFKTFSRYQWLKYLLGFAATSYANIYFVSHLPNGLSFIQSQLIIIPIVNVVNFIYNNWFVFK